MTPRLREKLYLYAHTLAMALGEGTLACASLAPTLGLTEEKCAFYLKQLGCKVDKKKKDEARLATLPLPLSFPKLGRGRKIT